MTSKKSTKPKQDDKIIYAFIATFLSIVGFVLAIIIKRDDKYVMYYAKQSLAIFIIGAVAGVISMFLFILPIIGSIINFTLNLLVFILWLISWIYALSGKKKKIPVVSEWARKFNL